MLKCLTNTATIPVTFSIISDFIKNVQQFFIFFETIRHKALCLKIKKAVAI